MATDQEPKAPTREELKKFLPSQRLIKAFEKVFDLIPSDLITLERLTGEASTDANNAIAGVNKLANALNRFSDALELVALMPKNISINKDKISLEPIRVNKIQEAFGVEPVEKRLYLSAIRDVEAFNPANNALLAYNSTTNQWVKVTAIDTDVTDDTTDLIKSSATLSNGAAASIGTLTNAPAVGDPTKWVAIDDNGTTRYIPAW